MRHWLTGLALLGAVAVLGAVPFLAAGRAPGAMPAPWAGHGMMGSGTGGGMMGSGAGMMGSGASMMGPGMGHGMMGGQSGPAPSQAPAAPLPDGAVVVDLVQLRFAPEQISVPVGTTVVFINRDGFDHRVVQSTVADLAAGRPGFVSPILHGGEQWSYTFTAAGTYPVLCDVAGHHLAGMVGEIRVG